MYFSQLLMNVHKYKVWNSYFRGEKTKKKQKRIFVVFVRLLLGSSCNALSNAVVTQGNSPVGTNITYDADQRKILKVTPALFGVFPKV